ncbi:MAG: hypothetical protein JJU24_08500 [Natronohydrobacter sp.]|nr:hypothetical protein [Natronohydrobacter sp.]
MAAKKRFLLERAQEVWEASNKGAALSDWRSADDETVDHRDNPAFASRRGAA